MPQMLVTYSNSAVGAGFACNATDTSQGLSVHVSAASVRINRSHLDIKYGLGQHKVITQEYSSAFNGKTYYFMEGTYRLEIPSGSNQLRKLVYISTPSGEDIVHEHTSGGKGYLFLTTDHLGSVQHTVNEQGNVLQELSFDAYGNRRRIDTWKAYGMGASQPSYILDKGFTGHQHLDAFALIDMKGRVYDPYIGRFLSPDPYVQMPDYSQNFNRYSYCLNNPLKYTDPDGEWLHLAIGAFMGGFANWAANGGKFTWEGAKYFGIGAVAGALTAGIGAGISSALPIAGQASGGFAAGFLGTSAATTATSSFVSGALIGGGSGLAGGFTTGFGNALIDGKNFGQALGQGGIYGAIGLGSGALIGGIAGGIDAIKNGRHFITGKTAYYEANLEDFSLVYQNDPMNCKNATLESIEKMKGGTRTQADFKRLGDAFLKENPKATLEEYFEHFGFNIQNPQDWTYRQIGRGMELGHPTVIDQNMGGGQGHTLTITKIRQWTPNSNVKVWFGDPARGMWKANWNIFKNPNFSRGTFLFWLR